MTDILQSIQSSDTLDILKIYAQRIAGGKVTFETQVPACEKWGSTHIPECRRVSEAEDVLFDWGTLSKASQRKVFEGVAEVRSYISKILQKIGIVSIFLKSLITSEKEAGVWTFQSQRFTGNIPSIRLLKKYGFRQNSTREKNYFNDNLYHGKTMAGCIFYRTTNQAGGRLNAQNCD
jgi:L-amino acid N-acyltransferase YncA